MKCRTSKKHYSRSQWKDWFSLKNLSERLIYVVKQVFSDSVASWHEIKFKIYKVVRSNPNKGWNLPPQTFTSSTMHCCAHHLRRSPRHITYFSIAFVNTYQHAVSGPESLEWFNSFYPIRVTGNHEICIYPTWRTVRLIRNRISSRYRLICSWRMYDFRAWLCWISNSSNNRGHTENA